METQPYIGGAPRQRKSMCMTYFLWLIGGFFGLHYIYLGRDNQAIATWISFGGYFGLSVLTDLWKIPDYVRDANQDPEYIARLARLMRANTRDGKSKPNFGMFGFLAALIVSNILGHLAHAAIPYEWIDSLNESRENAAALTINAIVVPFCVALGVCIVGNVGRSKGSFRYPLIGALLTSPMYYFGLDPVFFTSIVSTIAFTRYSHEWYREPIVTQLTLRRIAVLLVAGVFIAGLWSSWFYFNCNVTDKNEQTVKCRDAVKNFFKSPAWLEFKSVLGKLYEFISVNGFSGFWNEIVQALDPQGEQNALKVFNLTEAEATKEKITATYRSLAKQWHPDKHHDPESKGRAQEMFMSIQQAYEVLSNIKGKRSRRHS